MQLRFSFYVSVRINMTGFCKHITADVRDKNSVAKLNYHEFIVRRTIFHAMPLQLGSVVLFDYHKFFRFDIRSCLQAIKINTARHSFGIPMS